MKRNKIIAIIVVILVGIIVIAQSAYVIKETEQVVITQFGKPIGDPVTEPGLKFKAPFIQTANYFEKRYLEWDGDPNQVPTKDKKFIFVDTYARWQITQPLQFYKRLTNERGAQSRLDDLLDGETRDAVASHDLVELVRNTNRQAETSGKISELIEDSLADINVGRKKIQDMVLETANKQAEDLGIKILDFRFKRINYVENVRKRVYDRMRSERIRIADKFRSEGQGEASRINGKKERELNQIQSEAFKEAEKIRGRADAQAANIYADAYNQSRNSQKFYEFTKTLETFRKTFDTSTTVIFSDKSELYKYLQTIE
ncbi:MAG: protease modulator HflC [Bacteroidales bacterium]|nr:protease modulator HflC [Bacteroidales bacterium]MCF8333363.1 protease modulator HflC [Bacteroidales bacterium]